jgi:Flp pilus assembly protein CpaB
VSAAPGPDGSGSSAGHRRDAHLDGLQVQALERDARVDLAVLALGGRLTEDQLAAVQYRDGEICEFAFTEESRLDDLTIPRLARRIRSTMQARRIMRPTYLEEGTSPTKH